MKLLYGLLLYPYLTMAQSPAVKPLSIGDTVPDITFTQMVNSKSQITKLSAFKGKLIILDFWATWCGNCIRKFPLLDSLQRTHADQLQVILVNTAATKDSRQRISNFMARVKNTNGSNWAMPVIYNDTLLAGYFPHTAIPHYAWLSKDRVLLAVTGQEELTAANILRAVNTQQANFTGLHKTIPFDYSRPLFPADSSADHNPLSYSVLTAPLPGYTAGYRLIKNGTTARYTMINMPLLELVAHAWGISDQQKRIQKPAPGIIDETALYCYEYAGQASTLREIMPFMQQAIQQQFRILVKKEKLPVPCYTLSADTAILSQFRSKGGPPLNQLYSRETKQMKNQPLSLLTAWLDKLLDKPVIQENDPGFNLDLDITTMPVRNIQQLKAFLLNYGMILNEATGITEQFIIIKSPKQKLP